MADNVKVKIAERNGVELDFTEEYELVADNIQFNSGNTESVKTVVDNLTNIVTTSASPGFSFGRSSNVNNGTWLQCETVPSNKSGRFVYIANPVIERIFVSSETISNYTIEVFEHEGDEINLTFLGSVNIISSRGGSFPVTIPVTENRQLALRLTSGSARNVVAGLELSGSN